LEFPAKGYAMTTADVPADGEVRIGAIRLPAGRRVRGRDGQGEPVAWATAEPVPDAGRVWAALSEAHAQSGLVPVLLAGLDGDPERPWDTQEFRDPDDLTELDHLDAAELLREDWRQQTTEYDDYDEEGEAYGDDDFARARPGSAWCRPGGPLTRCLSRPCCAPGRTASVPGSCGSGSPRSASWPGGHRAPWTQPST
jgi:hypothetical protein